MTDPKDAFSFEKYNTVSHFFPFRNITSCNPCFAREMLAQLKKLILPYFWQHFWWWHYFLGRVFQKYELWTHSEHTASHTHTHTHTHTRQITILHRYMFIQSLPLLDWRLVVFRVRSSHNCHMLIYEHPSGNIYACEDWTRGPQCLQTNRWMIFIIKCVITFKGKKLYLCANCEHWIKLNFLNIKGTTHTLRGT